MDHITKTQSMLACDQRVWCCYDSIWPTIAGKHSGKCAGKRAGKRGGEDQLEKNNFSMQPLWKLFVRSLPGTHKKWGQYVIKFELDVLFFVWNKEF